MIHLTDSGYPPGTVIVAAALQPRYYEFHLSLDRVAAPHGTKLHIERSCDVTQNFNNALKVMLGEWAWFLGDDHSFSPTVLMQLLSRNVDVVVPITPTKQAPWAPCVLHGPGDGSWNEKMPLYRWEELSMGGLFPLPFGDYIGQAGMLVKKHVLDRIGYPWFKCGQIDKGRMTEDLYFCGELQRLGVTVYVDTDIVIDHHAPTCITARKHDGVWVPGLRAGTGSVCLIPEMSQPQTDLTKHYAQFKSRVQWVPVEDEEAPV